MIDTHLMAMICQIVQQLLLAVVQAIVKHTTLQLGPIMAYRGIIIMLLNYSVIVQTIKSNKQLFYPQKNILFQNIISTSFMSLAAQMVFFSQRLIPLGIAQMIYLTQVLWSQFIASLIYNSALKFSRIINILISFAGLLFIIQPFGNSHQEDVPLLGTLLCLLASVITALGQVIASLVGGVVNQKVQVHYFQFFHTIWGTQMMIYFESDSAAVYKPYNLLILTSVSLLTYAANLLQYKSLRLERADKLAPYILTLPLTGMLIEYFVFGQTLTHNQLIGCLIIGVSTALTMLQTIRS